MEEMKMEKKIPGIFWENLNYFELIFFQVLQAVVNNPSIELNYVCGEKSIIK